MSGTEYVLLVLVILVPALLAVGVTLWSLEQVRLRSKRNRKRRASPGSLRAIAAANTSGIEPPLGVTSVDERRGEVVGAVGRNDAGASGTGRDATKGRKSVGGG